MTKQEMTLIANYSKSLVDVVFEQEQVELVMTNIESCLTVFSETQLESVLSSQSYTHEDKMVLVKHFQTGHSVFWDNFLELILLNKREALLKPILESALEQLAQKAEVFDLTVTSAVPLTETQKERMTTLACQKMGLTVGRLIEKIDASLIGGFVMKANNKIIDTSLKAQLQEFKMNLK